MEIRPAGAAALALAGWTIAAAAVGAGQILTIGSTYDGGAVNLTPGDALIVRLPSGPGPETCEAAMIDPTVVKAEAPPAAEKAGSGEPPAQEFRFQAVAAGSSSVGIACGKTADRTSPPSRLFRVLVVVKAAVPRRAVTLEEPDNGSQIFLTQGERVFVKLPSSPATGYGWTIARNAPSVLQPVGDPRFEPPEKALPGASGFQVFEFRIVAGGASSLAMVYRRPFEKDLPPARTWGIFLSSAAVSAPPS